MANGLVPVGAGWRGAADCGAACGCCSGCCWAGDGDWKGELEVGAVNGWLACGEERAKGFVDTVLERCGVDDPEDGLVAVKGEPVCCWSMDCRKGLVVCWGACRLPGKPGAPVWKLATESCGIGDKELDWNEGWGEKPPNPAPV